MPLHGVIVDQGQGKTIIMSILMIIQNQHKSKHKQNTLKPH